MKPSFFLGFHPEKIQVEFYPIFFQGGESTNLFKTKSRVQIRGAIESSYHVAITIADIIEKNVSTILNFNLKFLGPFLGYVHVAASSLISFVAVK